MIWSNTAVPHARNRHILPLLLKKLKFAPVLAIQGVRQSGKSFLVRHLLPRTVTTAQYVLLDTLAERNFAQTNPSAFLAHYNDAFPLMIDEAQKAPVLFDEIKALVDENRRPGKFLLLGSTEFSKLTQVRESLTGRMSRIRLYPLTIAETLGLVSAPILPDHFSHKKCRITRAQMIKHLQCGGMPALFSVRNSEERQSLIQDWFDLTTKRDVHQFQGIKVDEDLCFRILENLSRLDEPSAGSLARALRQDVRRIKTQLLVLKTLFVVQELSPHPLGGGKPLYFHCDVGLASHLGANFERQLYTWVLQEFLSQFSYADWYQQRLYYYRAPRGGLIHFLIESGQKIIAVKIMDKEGFDKREIEILKAIRQRYPQKSIHAIALGAARHSIPEDNIEIFPWEILG